MRACRSVDQLRKPWRVQRRRPDPQHGLEKAYGKPLVPMQAQARPAWTSKATDLPPVDAQRLHTATALMSQSNHLPMTDSGTAGYDGSPDLSQLYRSVEESSAVARNAERRANVLHTFIRRQSEWLSRWAQEMRQQGHASAQACNGAGVLSISWQRWDEFSNGVAEQAQHALHVLRPDASHLEDPDLDIEPLLASYEIENGRLLKELGSLSGEQAPLLDIVVEKPVSVGGRPCLCTRGCRCWGVGPLESGEEDRGADPVLTVAHGWLKNDDLRLHRRIISEQLLVVQRQQQLCQEQRVALNNWSKKFSEIQKELTIAKSEAEDEQVKAKRLQKMMRERVQKIDALNRELETSRNKVEQLSSVLEEALKEAKVLKDDLEPWRRVRAVKKIQRNFRSWQAVRTTLKAIMLLQRVARRYLTAKKQRVSRSKSLKRREVVDFSGEVQPEYRKQEKK